MNSNLVVISPKGSTESAQKLADALDADYFNPYQTKNVDFSKYKTVINYGYSPPIMANKVINDYIPINIAIDKRITFHVLGDLGITVPCTSSIQEALSWLYEGKVVVARTQVKGSNGKGLTYIYNEEQINSVEAKLYTQYIEHTHEFRINLWKDKVVSVYHKARLDDIDTGNQKFKFILYKGQETHPQIIKIASIIYDKIGLDFCGVDVLCDPFGVLHVLEVNSAPILFPYTLKKLVTLIKKEVM